MKKITFLFTGLLLIFSMVAFAKQIDEQTAKQVGQTFLSGVAGMKTQKSVDNLELVYRVGEDNGNKTRKSTPTTYFYVFNAGSDGFVIVAGDDNVSPILGYSHEGGFDPDNIPPNAKMWLDGDKNEIRYVIKQNIAATAQIQKEWEDYYNGVSKKTQKAGSVLPLLTTEWNQSPYYNDSCPGSSTKAVTGCVATAMAQIMKYWNYPTTGTGFHSYNHSTYGTLSANFGSTTYQWASMPKKLSSASTSAQRAAVATLMYHCGVSVDMGYGTSSSGAYVISARSPKTHCSEYAFKNYFGYKKSLKGLQRDNYTQSQWIDTLKKELDAEIPRPILYAGFGTAGGHAFVCDGYDENNKFHFNWGWGGLSDGYFTVNALNPSALGTGGGSGGFNSDQQIIVGLEPPAGGGNADPTSIIRLYSNLSMPSATLQFISDTISVTATIKNYDTVTFNGTFGAAVFNSKGMLLDFISTVSVSLPADSSTKRTFKRAGGPPFIPGDYNVIIFYKTTESDWVIVGNGTSYGQTNYKEFSIEYEALIETYSSFTVKNNAGRLIKDEPASINVNAYNYPYYYTDFYGRLSVMLLDLKGNIVQTIQTKDLATTIQGGYLPSNSSIKGGFTFIGDITVEPGTYLLTLTYQKKGTDTSRWTYAGSRYYPNPVFVVVEAPLVYADPYEVNDTITEAYTLDVEFSDYKATVKTTGSNFHVGTDKDYYKIDLPAGDNYSIKARLHDANNSGDGKIYYANGVFSYSTDEGETWSEAYDDIMPDSITVQDGGSVYFYVAPYFEGGTGSYLLEMNIELTSLGIKQVAFIDYGLQVLPNPAKSQLRITNCELQNGTADYSIYNVVGQLVQQGKLPDSFTINIESLANGMYYLRIADKTAKFVKE